MSRIIPTSCSILATLFLVCAQAMAAPAGPIRDTKTISAFPLPPHSVNSLVVAGDGNVYGASSQDYLVRVTPSGTLTVVHDFRDEGASTPNTLTLGKDGNLYGILTSNGSIFKSDLAGKVTILARLGLAAGPFAVFQAADGNLYGTTGSGGSANQGSVFKITPAGQLTTIYSFAGDTAGYEPTDLIETTPGIFYGVCRSSSSGANAIFRLTADGVFSIVHDFAGTNDNNPANLVFAGDGNVYGSYAHSGGSSYSIFRLTPAGELTPLSNVGSSNDIGVGDVVLGGDGNLYATTSPFGQPAGAIWRVTLSGEVTRLHNFSGADDGADPGRIAVGPNQVLYGATYYGSVAQCGTIYRIDSAGQFATLVRLGTLGEGYSPNGAFFQANDGSFYGTTEFGGSGGYGTIYHVASSGQRTTLHEFAADTGAPKLLILGKDGKLYGACAGTYFDTLFLLDTSGAFTVLHQFSGEADGARVTGLVASPDGNIYGVTTGDPGKATPRYGSFFEVTPAGTFSVVKAFDQSLGNPARFVGTKDGKLFGIGFQSNGGALFQIAPDGATTVVHSFAGDQLVGKFGALIEGPDGNLYGTVSGATVDVHGQLHVVGNGGLWRCSPTGAFSILHTFDNADGLFFPSLLVSTANGDLYGLANTRVIYRFTAAGLFEPIYQFDQAIEGLGVGQDGNLYGTSGLLGGLYITNGPLGGGVLFKFLFGNASAINLATRMNVGTGNNVSIGGFIITGSGPKKVLLRGIGPSLSLAGKLEDPVLELHDASGAVIGKNDNWRITQPGGVISGDQSAEIKASLLAPVDDREAALIASLSPGNYTAVVSGVQNTTGIGVVEIYDLDLEAGANLANISTRGFADTGDNMLIGGFITDGSLFGRSKLIVRALGPSLAQFGISNPLNDPYLTIYDQNGNYVAASDNWQDANEPEVLSYGLAPNDRHESALYLSLPGGNYTAVVTSGDGGTGVALIETYNLP